MAKKKDESVSNVEVIDNKKSMVSKVEVKQPDQDRISRIVGMIFIVLGICFVVYGIFSFVKYNMTPELDESLVAPSLSGTGTLVSGNSFKVEGIADGYDDVYVYVDDVKVGDVKVSDDGSFVYEYAVPSDGTYSILVAGVKGFPKRYISPVSAIREVVVDNVAPELTSVDYSNEVGTKTFSVVGVAEVGSTVVMKRGVDYYSSVVGDDGSFAISNVVLDDGANVFSMEVVDLAGNINYVNDKVRVVYSPDSDINGDAVMDDLDGDGVVDENLPVAGGDLDSALSELFGNRLMVVFGLLALVCFMCSSVVVFVRNKKSN